jgi:cation:H+ antiporter
MAGYYWRDRKDSEAIKEIMQEVRGIEGQKNLYILLLMVTSGLIGLGYGANLLVQGGVQIAGFCDVSKKVIGLT